MAIRLIESFDWIAPDLLFPECANVFWKKYRRGEWTEFQTREACATLSSARIRLVSSRLLLAQAMELSLELDHPAYDCFYLSLAEAEQLPLVTADTRFLAKLDARKAAFSFKAITLSQALAPRP